MEVKSNAATSLRRSSSRITANAMKRLKTNHNSEVKDDANDENNDDDRKQPATATETETAPTPTPTPTAALTTTETAASLRIYTSTIKVFPILHNPLLLQLIFSFVGEYQNRFISCVSRSFHEAYTSLYPKKITFINATSIEHIKLIYYDIEMEQCAHVKANRCWWGNHSHDETVKDEQRRVLWKVSGRYGIMEVIEYLHGMFLQLDRYKDWKSVICHHAAQYGHLHLLQWAGTNDVACESDDTVCQLAVASGHMDVLDWALNNKFCLDDKSDAGYMASYFGNMKALQWLHDNGGDLTSMNSYEPDTGCCNYAAERGHLEVLKWLVGIGCSYDENTIDVAVQCCHIEVIRYLLSNDCRTSDTTCCTAASRGNLVALQLLRSYDCEWDHLVIAYAAALGHLDIIEWAHNNGCPWSELSCQYAAGFGQLDTLKWLRQHDCPWDNKTTKYASTDEIYHWAVDNECPIGTGNPREQIPTAVNTAVHNFAMDLMAIY